MFILGYIAIGIGLACLALLIAGYIETKRDWF